VAIVYISHRLDEFKHIVDRVTIMRDGRCIIDTTMFCRHLDRRDRQPAWSAARWATPSRPVRCTPQDEKLLDVRGLVRKGVFGPLSFNLRRGEILGFAGLMGAGRTETARAVFGADPVDGGTIALGER
jgi:ribose transport system ATP-binding protein